ncbi:hypothetical protein H4582DRAFT_1883882 [Lactarius indigo]|nr:hypothetical protein H4582DRAFT_1883882 [Lactarius indigo]
MLLHWSTLEPAGPSNLAALRFSSLVRVRSLRIFPKDAVPFAEQPEIVSVTEPEAFVLDIYFNAHPISSDSKQKQKATNALVPTSLAYTGGFAEYPVDMGAEFASRLMIVKGNFTKLSMAIYGDVASELPSAPSSYAPITLPSLIPTPLSPPLDPANSEDPTTLTRNLLSLIPDAPPLSLVIRLMFCLKPANDDWDLPEFPYLHSDLDVDPMEFDLDYAYQLTSQPVADDVPLDVLRRFADRVADAIGPKSENQSYLVAGILSRVACQHRELSRLLIDRIDIRAIFDASSMEEDTLMHLLVAAANPDIAKTLTAADLPKELEALGRAPGLDPYMKRAAQRLIDRLRGWDELLAAIWEPNASFASARAVLRDLGGDEPSFGVALHAFVTHPDLVARISEAEELVELRAWVGVACVLAAYAWADSVPNELCRSRAFGVMRVWQGAPHYREVLNYLLLLRQMIFRLECMMDDDTPTRSGIHAEHILYDLTRDPRAFLSPHLIKCLLALQPGFSAINDAECATLRTLARLVDDGLPAAIKELAHTPARPVSADDLLKLRIATVVLMHELETGDSDEGEWATLNALWAQNTHGLPLHLLAALEILTADAQAHFSLTLPPPLTGSSSRASLTDLLAAANELLQVLTHLIPTYPLPGRAAHGLVNVVADLFASADAADMLTSVDSTRVAQGLRGTCVGIVRALDPELVLRTLLRRGADVAGASAASQDPARRAQHALSLVDLVLPLESDAPGADATRRALPKILPELATFFRVLDVDGRAHLVRRLAEFDGGVLGLAEWLVLEELRALGGALRVLAAHDPAHDPSPALCAVKAHQAVSALRLLHDLVRGMAPTAQRLLAFIGAESEPAGLLAAAMNLLLATRAASHEQVELAQALVQSGTLDRNLCFVLALVFLRAAQHASLPVSTPTSTPLALALTALRQVPIRTIEPDRLSSELGDALLVIASPTPSTSTMKAEAPAVLALLEWLVQQSHAGLPQLAALHGISTDTFAQLCDELAGALPGSRRAALEHVRMHLQTAHAEDAVPRPLVELPAPGAPVRLALDALLRPDAPHHHQHDSEDLEMAQDSAQPPLRATTPVHARGVLNMVTVSPPTALLRSPAVTGLTRTYTANDFRALRQTPSARQNTSRLPSTHVDEFQSAAMAASSSPVMMPMPIPVLPSNPYGMGLGAPFGS